MYRYFDYKSAAEAAGISPAEFAAIRRCMQGRYRSRMLREMHLRTAFTEIGAGRLTVAEALAPPTGEPPDPTTMRMGG